MQGSPNTSPGKFSHHAVRFAQSHRNLCTSIYIYMRPCQNSLSAYLSENPGHRSGWGPRRFTWLGDRVLILVLTCREMPLSWSRSKPVSLSHYALLGGFRLPWPPSCLSGPHRRLCFFRQCVSCWQHAASGTRATHLQSFGRGAPWSLVSFLNLPYYLKASGPT